MVTNQVLGGKDSKLHTIKMQICAKPEASPNIPEDVIGQRVDGNRVFLADGAGGTGVFAVEWAEFLSAYLPDKPIKSNEVLCKLIDNIWEGFFDYYIKEAENLKISDKFLEEGSYCTLIALWKTSYNRWEGFVYGDSVLLVYDKEGMIKICSINDINSFNKKPDLLSWKEQPLESAFQLFEIELAPEDTIWLMSDALAQYFLIAYNVINNTPQACEINKCGTKLANISERMYAVYSNITDFKHDIIEPLEKAIQFSETFEKYMKKLYKAGLLAYDDYSIISLNQPTLNNNH